MVAMNETRTSRWGSELMILRVMFNESVKLDRNIAELCCEEGGSKQNGKAQKLRLCEKFTRFK